MELRGAIVAITGASAGIGRETALAFARAGASVAACARRAERLRALEGELQVLGAAHLTCAVDVAVEEQVREFVRAVLARFGRVDVLVNNAGSGAFGTIEETPGEVWRRLLEVNLLGSLHAARAVLAPMRAQGRGVIIGISSLAGRRALPAAAAYSASKAALLSLDEALRVELHGTGVRVCSVLPVSTPSEFHESAWQAPGRAVSPAGPQQSAARVAQAIVACARRPRREAYPFPAARLLVWLNAVAPWLVDALVAGRARRAGRL